VQFDAFAAIPFPMAAIHQLVAGFSKGDAISNEARVLRDLFRSWGCASEIFCETKRILPELRKDARDLGSAGDAITADDVVVLHLSIGSPANEMFPRLRGRKVIVYHNITPPDFFRTLSEEIRANLRRGLEQARALAGAGEVTLADSKFNATELEAMGHRNVQVMPLLLDRTQWQGPADRAVLAKCRDGTKNILFVGRCAPNKRIEDLLHAFRFFQKYVEPESRLIHVGSWAGIERYYTLLRTKAADLRLQNVIFAGGVRAEELRAYYQAADVFLCMSEHEGFCIPLIEAMAHGVPVMAFAAGAVPDTLDGAGVLFREKKFDAIAEMLGRLCSDSSLRESVIASQRARVDRYFAQDIPRRWRETLAPLLRAS
jgi:glycosyltransferase involved in cell wall biosynthesis